MFPSHLVHHARHAFNYHTRPVFVNTPPAATDDPSTGAMQTTTTDTEGTATASPTSAATDAGRSNAVVLYPTGQPTINNIDAVEVTYDTIWENANLTLFCGIDEGENKWALANIPLRT